LKSPARVNRRCRGGRSVVRFIFQRPLVYPLIIHAVDR
jgi:hypothetical protein